MTIHEPATLLTDYALAVLAAGLMVALLRADSPRSSARTWLAVAMGLVGLSALVGGTYHGFAPEWLAAVAAAVWKLTLVTIHLVSAALALCWSNEVLPPRWQGRARGVIAVKLAVFAVWAVSHPVFAVVIADYGSIMVAWAVAALVLERGWRGWMLTAVGLSACAAAVQQLHVGLGAHFNHNDLYHVIQGVALIAFYQAGRRL